ncbi:molybdate ABC transporter substrate-binding protein [Phycobium rhodophyticola]
MFAAASLKTALDEVAETFESRTGHTVTRSYAGSSALARQIELGAPADVFISANSDWMDYLAKGDLIESATRHDLLTNRLVLVAPTALAQPIKLERGMDLAAHLNGGFLAMALVNAVPAGIYGKAALDHFGLWEGIASQVAQTNRQCARRACPCGIGRSAFGRHL